MRPLLIIVGGAPGTGKTTLARELASRLRLALVAKDDMKEALADAVGSGDRTRSRELGRAAYAVMRAVAARCLASGVGVILEANFHRELSGGWLRGLAALAPARVIVCRTTAALSRRRFAERRAAGA